LRFTDSLIVDPAGGCSTASLFVDPAADYLKDHFPGAPTLPGLVMLESAVRAAAALWESTPDATGASSDGRTPTLAHVERLQIVRRVVPGETFVVEARPDGDGFTARGTVGGETAMRAKFRLIRR
jgi:3-hydroxymyristoyl/3-hydroxydecanoyl-(acyl carrier protein) dehydratase